MDERRQYVRLDANLEVSYSVLKDAPLRKASMKNLGAGGVSFLTSEPLEVGLRLRVQVGLPHRKPVVFSGEVVWSDLYERTIAGSPVKDRYRTSLRILSIDAGDREAIRQFVSSAM